MRTTKTISTLLLTATVLAGCADDPAPREPGRSASPTPTSTASPPPMPEQATENSAEGAAAFLDHYLDVMNYASHTGDVDPLRDLSLDDCTGCQKYIDLYTDHYASGGSYEGGEWTVPQLALDHGPDETFLTSDVAISAGVTHYADAPAAESPSETVRMTFAVRFESGWRTSQLALGDPQ